MACICKKCQNRRVPCGEELCDQCFLDECCKTDTEKRLYSGGRFYGEKLIKEVEDWDSTIGGEHK